MPPSYDDVRSDLSNEFDFRDFLARIISGKNPDGTSFVIGSAPTLEPGQSGFASAVAFNPVGTIGATDVQAAIVEVEGDAASALSSLAGKADTSHHHGVADLGTGTPALGKYLDGDNSWKVLPSAQSGSAEDVTVNPAVNSNTDVQAVLEDHEDRLDAAGLGNAALFVREARPDEGATAWVWFETDADGTPTGTVEAYSPDPDAPTSAPSNTVAPAITGTAETGQTLSCSTGTWTQSPTSYARQWKRDGANISGATGATYVLQSADVSHNVKCTVTATNVIGSTPADSNTVTPSNPAAPTNSVAPAVTGTTTTGQTLTCSTGTWTGSPTSYAYQWKRGGVNISGATSSTYVLQVADEGTAVKCAVTATNAGGSNSADSNTVNPTAPASFDEAAHGTRLAHYKADAGTSSTVDGTGLSAWNDQSSNARNFAQPTSGNRPVYKASIVNGLPVVRFDGTDDWMQTAVAGSPWTTADTLTVLIVRVRRAYVSGGAGMVILSDNVSAEYATPENLWAGVDSAADSTGDWRNGLNIGVRTHPGNDVAFLETLKFDGTDEVAYNNGTAVKTDGSAGVFGFKTLVLAARYGNDQTPAAPFGRNDMCEMVILSGASDTNRQDWEAHLIAKWGIS